MPGKNLKIIETKIGHAEEIKLRDYVEQMIKSLNNGDNRQANKVFDKFCELYEDIEGEIWESKNV